MGDQDQFGPRLRREREKRRISLEEIATATNVGVELWQGLEQNDFSRWPTGIFARAFVRDYARVVGLDADAVVNEFCRHFPIADRRGNRIVRAHAELIGHAFDVAPGSEPLPAGRDRRRPRQLPERPSAIPAFYRPRLIAAAVDLTCVVAAGSAASTLAGGGFWAWSGAAAIVYFTAGTILLGMTPGFRLIEAIRHRATAIFANRRAVSA